MNRKLILAAAAASALLLSSCRKADEVTSTDAQLDELEFTATIDGPSTKTTVNTDKYSDDRGKIEWEKGDSILIKDAKENAVYYVTEEGDGTFRKKAGQSVRLGSGPYTATYGTAPSTTQNYADHYKDATHARNVYMTAESTNRSLNFKAACGLLKLTLTAKDKAEESITKIDVSGKVNGTDATYTLNCVKEDGTAVSISSATDFYLTLPKGEYNRMVFYNKKDKSCEKQCKDENEMEIKDNIIQPVTINDVTFETEPVFSVTAKKKVKFTSGNLWWGKKDGEDSATWHLESSQTAYPASWDASHVGHFYWTKAAEKSYAESYDDGERTTGDVPFFAESKGGLTVDGQGGLYALTVDEWYYLINSRTNASSLYKTGVSVTIGDKTANKCLVIAPDGYTGTIAASYSAAEWKTAEESCLVCLPAAGYRGGSGLKNGGSYGLYWSATPYGDDEYLAYGLCFDDSDVYPSFYDDRYDGFSVRLVCSVSK